MLQIKQIVGKALAQETKQTFENIVQLAEISKEQQDFVTKYHELFKLDTFVKLTAELISEWFNVCCRKDLLALIKKIDHCESKYVQPQEDGQYLVSQDCLKYLLLSIKNKQISVVLENITICEKLKQAFLEYQIASAEQDSQKLQSQLENSEQRKKELIDRINELNLKLDEVKRNSIKGRFARWYQVVVDQIVKIIQKFRR